MKDVTIGVSVFLVLVLWSFVYNCDSYNKLLLEYVLLLEEEKELINDIKLAKVNYYVIYLKESENMAFLNVNIEDGVLIDIEVMNEISLKNFNKN